jgi:hypothetical protein
VFVLDAPVACCVIEAEDEAVWVSPENFPAFSYTTAVLDAVALLWLIEHDCVSPVVLMHTARFFIGAEAANDRPPVAARRAVSCTTAQRAVLHTNMFLPPVAAICTTGWFALVHAQPAPGHRGPA